VRKSRIPRSIWLFCRTQNLYKLFAALHKARGERGAIDFETTETMMLFNEQGKIENIVPVVRNDAHRIIEECMLAANVCASDFWRSTSRPACTAYMLRRPRTSCRTCVPFSANSPGARRRRRSASQGLRAAAREDQAASGFPVAADGDAALAAQAMYSPDNVGHFGLAYEHYTHFTSPIRRYPDLLVHRAIKAVLDGEKYVPERPWDDIGLQCSATERRADEATRDVENWLKTFFMKERIGEEFDGTISAVTAFGIFVALDQVYVEGLVHVSELGADYFQFDNIKHQMLGERTGQRFRLGDRVRVRLVRADLESNRIDFVMAQAAAAPRKSMGRSDSAGKTVSRQATRPAKASVKAGQTCGGESRQQGGTQKAASKPAAAPAKAKSASHARPQRNDASAQ
jgi:ribonuclease R